MTVCIEPTCNQPQCDIKPMFMGTYKRTEQGNPYYHTNTGLAIGGTFAGLSIVANLFKKQIANLAEKANEVAYEKEKQTLKPVLSAEDWKKLEEQYIKDKEALVELKKAPFGKFLAIGIAGAAVHTVCGLIVDNIRNKKSAQVMDEIRQKGVKQAMAENDRIEISDNKHPYYKSNVGTKTGAILGVFAGLAIGALNNMSGIKAHNMLKTNKAGFLASQVIGGAIGGALLGHLADSRANKSSERNA